MRISLTKGVELAKYAESVLQQVKSLEEQKNFYKEWDINKKFHLGIEPMLLAFSMELALKAWYIFDFNDAEVIKTHNLHKIFRALKPKSQDLLSKRFKQTVAITNPDFFYLNYDIKDILYANKHAFTEWRYIYESKKSLHFNQSGFTATIETVSYTHLTLPTTSRV